MRELLRRIHDDERGAVSIETVLLLGFVSIPILVFLIAVAWPRIRGYFIDSMDQLESAADSAKGGC